MCRNRPGYRKTEIRLPASNGSGSFPPRRRKLHWCDGARILRTTTNCRFIPIAGATICADRHRGLGCPCVRRGMRVEPARSHAPRRPCDLFIGRPAAKNRSNDDGSFLGSTFAFSRCGMGRVDGAIAGATESPPMAGKWLLKAAFGELLPPAICARGKQGFGVPMGLWLRKELRDWARERLFNNEALTSGFDFQVKRLLDEHDSGKSIMERSSGRCLSFRFG